MPMEAVAFIRFILINNTLLEFNLKGETLCLLKEKAVWWPEKKAIIISDVHLGKVSHFRKNGIQAPIGLIDKELKKIQRLLSTYQPEQFIIVGDLFHSDINKEWDAFAAIVETFKQTQLILVRGNHDKMAAYLLKQSGIKATHTYLLEPFEFSHEPLEYSTRYVFSGHIHPGVSLKGNARQSLTMPCFYFGEDYALLPAFGNFTGIQIISPKKSDRVFGVTTNHVMQLN